MIERKPSRRLEELTRERARLDVELQRCKESVTVLLVDVVGSARYCDKHSGVADSVIVQKWVDVLDRLGDSRA